MEQSCSKCEKQLNFPAGSVVGRTEECPACGTDLHSCIQCRFYDESAYNQCSEPQAERVVEKERANFCDYFQLGGRSAGRSANAEKDAAKKKLDDLFK